MGELYKRATCAAVGAALFAMSVSASTSAIAQEASSKPDDATRLATDMVARLSLEEKLPQLLNVAPAIPRLNVPAYNWWTESLHGALGPVPTTNFPEPIGLAATFDAPLVKNVATAIS